VEGVVEVEDDGAGKRHGMKKVGRGRCYRCK
jgi:hypothetical protein